MDVPDDVRLALFAAVYAEEFPLWKSMLLGNIGLLFSLAHIYSQHWVTVAASSVWMFIIIFVSSWADRLKHRRALYWEAFWKPTALWILCTVTAQIFRSVFCGADLSSLHGIRKPQNICPAAGTRYWTTGSETGTAALLAYAAFGAVLTYQKSRQKAKLVDGPILRYWEGVAAHEGVLDPRLTAALEQLVNYFRFPGWITFIVYKAGWLWTVAFILREILVDQTVVGVIFYVLSAWPYILSVAAMALRVRHPQYRLASFRGCLLPLHLFAVNLTAESIVREVACSTLHKAIDIGPASKVFVDEPRCRRQSSIVLGIAGVGMVLSLAGIVYDYVVVNKPVWRELSAWSEAVGKPLVSGKPE